MILVLFWRILNSLSDEINLFRRCSSPLNQILNVSPNLHIAIYLEISLAYLTFFNDVEEHEFPLNCTKS